jgi:hypothetical protein
VNEKNQVTQERLSDERKKRRPLGIHKRGSRLAEKHRRTESTEKVANTSKPIPGSLGRDRKLKTQSQDKPCAPGDRLAILVSG